MIGRLKILRQFLLGCFLLILLFFEGGYGVLTEDWRRDGVFATQAVFIKLYRLSWL